MKQFWRNLMTGELSPGAAFLLIVILIAGSVAFLAIGEEAVEELTENPAATAPADHSAATPSLQSMQWRIADVTWDARGTRPS